MNTYKQHLELAGERFLAAEREYSEGKVHTAAHLFINAAVNYHNALCQKFLSRIPSHKAHHDTSYFLELSRFLGNDFSKYRDAYEFLISHKNQSDYGVELSFNIAKQIYRRAQIIKDIAEDNLS